MATRVSKSGGSIETVNPQPKAGPQTGFDTVDLLGVSVTGQDYLLLAVKQGVESMKKFFLCSVFAGKELDIVYEQSTSGTVTLLEVFYPVTP